MNTTFSVSEFCADYWQCEYIEAEQGLVAYELEDDVIHIPFCYVRKEHRGSGNGRELFKQIKKIGMENNVGAITADVETDSNYCSYNVGLFLRVGFIIYGVHGNRIQMAYDLREET
jgi:ribosomal protein S18 acetylase RimI-like enzyme